MVIFFYVFTLICLLKKELDYSYYTVYQKNMLYNLKHDAVLIPVLSLRVRFGMICYWTKCLSLE